MYNGIGLKTVRGTATSGHVQHNRGHVSASRQRRVWSQNQGQGDPAGKYQPVTAAARLQGNADIQFHAAKRQLENDLLLLREELEDEEGLVEEDIDARIDRERQRRLAVLEQEHETRMEKVKAKQEQQTAADTEKAELNSNDDASDPSRPSTLQDAMPRHRPYHPPGNTKTTSTTTNTHLAALHKERETGRLADALGIRPEAHTVGKAFDFEGQKQKKLEQQREQEKLAAKEEKKRRKEERKAERERRRQAKKERKMEKKRKKAAKRRRRRSPSPSGSESSRSSWDSRSYSESSEESRRGRSRQRRRRSRSPSSSSSRSLSSSRSRDSGERQRGRKSEIPKEIEPVEKTHKRRRDSSSEGSRASSDDGSRSR